MKNVEKMFADTVNKLTQNVYQPYTEWILFQPRTPQMPKSVADQK